jgi:hypothetical protein
MAPAAVFSRISYGSHSMRWTRGRSYAQRRSCVPSNDVDKLWDPPSSYNSN